MDDDKEQRLRKRLADGCCSADTVEPEILDPLPFQYAGRPLDIVAANEEFTHICPMTGLPDFGTVEIEYVPDKLIIELKSLKYYLLQYRQVGIFYEHVVIRILDDLVAVLAPRRISIRYRVDSRGGIRSVVSASWPESPAMPVLERD